MKALFDDMTWYDCYWVQPPEFKRILLAWNDMDNLGVEMGLWDSKIGCYRPLNKDMRFRRQPDCWAPSPRPPLVSGATIKRELKVRKKVSQNTEPTEGV